MKRERTGMNRRREKIKNQREKNSAIYLPYTDIVA
jgi:hypothetical protein